MSEIAIILPAYNEEKTLTQVVRNLHQSIAAPHHFIVVDDGSSDRTAEMVPKELPHTILRHETNRGLGSALKTGYLHALSTPVSTILTVEADATQPPEVVAQLIDCVQEGIDIAIASPLIQNSYQNVPVHRRFLSHGANLLYRSLFPIADLIDYTNLSRAIQAPLLHRALDHYGPDRLFNRSGFEAVPDLLLKLRPFHPKVSQIPVTINFHPDSCSSNPLLKTLFSSLSVCLSHLRRA